MDNSSAGFVTTLRKKILNPKIIFIILGMIVLAEVVYAVRVLTLPVSTSPPPARKVTAQKTAGSISLNASKTNLKVNETVAVSVMVDTGGHTVNGIDLVVSFDPKVLEITQTGLIKGKIFDEYPLLSADAKKGLISILGISSSNTGFKGNGEFAIINIKAKTAGKASLLIDFKGKGDTRDSNLVETNGSEDILERVNSLELIVQ